MHKWSLHDAKNKLSDVINQAISGQAQCITKRGEDAVVVISITDYQKLKNKHISFKHFLTSGDKFDDINFPRIHGAIRQVEL